MRGPLTYQINGFKIGTVKYLALIKVERVMPKVSCLSHEGEHRGEEKHPIDRKQVKKKEPSLNLKVSHALRARL